MSSLDFESAIDRRIYRDLEQKLDAVMNDHLDCVAGAHKQSELLIAMEQEICFAQIRGDAKTLEEMSERRERLLALQDGRIRMTILEGRRHFHQALAAIFLHELIQFSYVRMHSRRPKPPLLGSVLDVTAHFIENDQWLDLALEKRADLLGQDLNVQKNYRKGVYRAAVKMRQLFTECLILQMDATA
jgi:hypothetical protein